jgi:glycosyltransferase involved in cell wall biosynthesis
MTHKKLKVLLIVEQCNPEWASVPLVGYNFVQPISKLVDATVVTHIRNKPALEKHPGYEKVLYIEEGKIAKNYYKIVEKLTAKGRINWSLYNALSYPIYEEFNQQVYQKFQAKILNGDYDIVHAITPMMPRYPFKVVSVCQQPTPFILGPVNGGIPFPPGFQETARQEFAQFNFLRAVGRALIPGYVETYKKADKILAGSTYTLNMLKDLFTIPDPRIELFYENGIASSFLTQKQKIKKDSQINLFFVGRLVPYRCADILIEAVGKIEPNVREKVHVTIVGDGQERKSLETKVQKLHLVEKVKFAGLVGQAKTLDYYRQADIFGFPSIREFGGAVVIEAMACGLPCIVANNGGIGEYVTEETGFKIEPISIEYLTEELTKKIKILVEDEKMRSSMSAKSIERAREFEWDNKARKIVEIYEKMIDDKKGVSASA